MKYRTILVGNYILIEPETDVYLVFDTGSPVSFCKTGSILLNGKRFAVPEQSQLVSYRTLKDMIGIEVSGLLGMDIIEQLWISSEMHQGLPGTLMIEDGEDGGNGSHIMEKSIGKVPVISVPVNGKPVSMLLDSGAPLSYIGRRFTQGLRWVDSFQDLMPSFSMEPFRTDVYALSVFMQPWRSDSTIIRFGNLPEPVETLLHGFGVDGIAGSDFFQKYRLWINKGVVSFPPQGI